jgi:hypothetical protein
MKIAVFWVVAPCSLVDVYQRFRGPCCLHHQGDQILQGYSILFENHLGEDFVLPPLVHDIVPYCSCVVPFCTFYYCHSVINVTVAMACFQKVLCKSCVISIVMYVLHVFGIPGMEGSSCLSYIFEWTSLTL